VVSFVYLIFSGWAGDLQETSSGDIHDNVLLSKRDKRENMDIDYFPLLSFPSTGGKTVSSPTHRPPFME
jgi:hypothetical protein